MRRRHYRDMAGCLIFGNPGLAHYRQNCKALNSHAKSDALMARTSAPLTNVRDSYEQVWTTFLRPIAKKALTSGTAHDAVALCVSLLARVTLDVSYAQANRCPSWRGPD